LAGRKILFVSHEVAPFAKVGGLADVAGSLPLALREQGHDVRVLMPAYRMVLENREWAPRPLAGEAPVAVNPLWTVSASAFETRMGEVPVWLLRAGNWFDATVSSETVYLPGENQHIAFARAALELCRRMDWSPDVVHSHDWHTGLLPVFLKEPGGEAFAATASVHTIHNLAYQGVFPPETVLQAGLPWELFDMHRLETWGQFNFLKAACVYADRVNTVSPTYAQEIQTAEYGCTLEGVMRHLAENGRLTGILNGIDLNRFDPASDSHIAAPYGVAQLEGKAACRQALLDELGWDSEPEIPVAGIVTRLSQQKGLDLVLAAAKELAELPLRIVVLGVGEPWIAERLLELQAERPDRFRLANRFDEGLAQRIYAGSDLFLMPSSFEPCGLGQMIAMRYGTLPVARRTGGLADTIADGKDGFLFEDRTAGALLECSRRACATLADPDRRQAMLQAAMGRDFGWTASAQSYARLYEEAIEARLQKARAG
jgi:starch synthase